MRTQNCKMFILDYRQARGAAGREDGCADHDEVSAAVAADPGAVPRHVQGAPPLATPHCCWRTVAANLTCRRWTHSSWRPPRRTRRATLCLSRGDCSSGN